MPGPEPDGFRRPPTAQEAVLGELRQAIASGELRPGAQVLQVQLAERLGVSRVPLREALKILEGEGQVVYHPHRGYFVAELSAGDLIEVYRIRAILETEALRVGGPLADQDDFDRVETLLRHFEAAAAGGDLGAMTAANRDFHFALYGTSRMPRLIRMIRLCWDATDVYRSVYYAQAGHRQAAVAEHRGIAAAFRDGDVDLVVLLLDEHRRGAVTSVTAALAD